MSQPLSTVIRVTATRQTQFVPRASFNLGNIMGVDPIISVNERIRFYNNLAGVAQDYDTSSEEYKAANFYFGQTPSPFGLYISRWVNANIAAELRTGANYTSTISTWQAVANGSFRISIDGTTANVTAIDFTSAANLIDVASIIQAKLVAAGFTGATCVYNTTLSLFVIKSGTTGASSTITYLTTSTASVGTDISGLGGTKFLDGAAGSSSDLNQGMVAETPVDALIAINEKDPTWFGLTTTDVIRDDANVILIANWIEAQKDTPKLYFVATNDAATYSNSDTTSVSYQLMTIGATKTNGMFTAYDTEYIDAAFMAKDFSYDPGTYTDKFKQLALITPNDQLTQNQVNIIKSKHCNLYCTVSGAAITQEGVVYGGDQEFGEYIDVMRFIDWLINACGIDLYNYIRTLPKVPLTDDGVSALIQVASGPCIEAERRGGIAARIDTDGTLLPAFTITAARVSTVPPSQLAARTAPPLIINVRLAGAIHFASAEITLTL